MMRIKVVVYDCWHTPLGKVWRTVFSLISRCWSTCQRRTLLLFLPAVSLLLTWRGGRDGETRLYCKTCSSSWSASTCQGCFENLLLEANLLLLSTRSEQMRVTRVQGETAMHVRWTTFTIHAK